MTADSLELRYTLSAKDREGMFRFLENRSLSAQSAETRYFSNRYVLLAACIFVLITVFQWVVQLVSVIAAHGFARMLSPWYVIGNVIGVLLSYALIQYVWASIAGYRQREKIARSKGDGVRSGEHHLCATPAGLTIRRAKRRTVYKWAAFLDLVETKYMLLLVVTQRHAVTIPKDAFQSKTEEQSFREYIRGHIATS